MATRRSSFAAWMAAFWPAGPEPMTRSSYSSPMDATVLPAMPWREAALIHELARHRVDGDPPQDEAEDDECPKAGEVGPALPAESGVADELDAVVERIELARDLRPLRQLAQREEGARDQEEWSEDRADHVVEVLERGREAGDRDAKASPAEAGDPGDQGNNQHSPGRIEAEDEGNE